MRTADNLIQITLLTLRSAPDDWTFDQFKAVNEKLGIEVWIANGAYGLRIKGPGVSTREESRPFTGWLIPWRRAVLRAVRDAGSRELLRRFAVFYPEQAKRLGDPAAPPGNVVPAPCPSATGRG